MDRKSLLLAPTGLGLFILLTGLAEHETLKRVVLGLALLASSPLLLACSQKYRMHDRLRVYCSERG